MIKTIRKLIEQLLMSCGEIDDKPMIAIFQRDKDGNVIAVARFEISRIDTYDNICADFTEIKWYSLNEFDQIRSQK